MGSDLQWRLEPVLFSDSKDIPRTKAVMLSQCYHATHLKLAFKDYAGALADLNSFVNANPKFATAYAVRAHFEHELGYDDDAFADCIKATNLNPQAPYPYTVRGYIEAESFHNYANARADFEKTIKLDPNNVGDYDDCAWIARITTNNSGAFEYLDHAIQLDKTRFTNPRSGNPYAYLAWIQGDLFQYKPALENFRKALERNPTTERYWLHIWLLRARLGERQEATSDLVKQIGLMSKAELNLWQTMCERFLVGAVNEEDLMRTVSDPAFIGRIKRTALCSANYYIGMKHFLDGDKKSALLSFRNALNTGLNGYFDYESTVAEAARLEKE